MVRLLDANLEQKWFGGTPPPYDDYVYRASLIAPYLAQWGVSKTNGKILVVGSAYGHLLTAIRAHDGSGWQDVWGIDSTYAKARSNVVTQIQQVRDRLGIVDATSLSALRSFKQGVAGVGGPQSKWAAIITEDVLSTVHSAAEVNTILSNLRGESTASGSRMIHFITMYDPTQSWSGIMSPESMADGYYQNEATWRSLIRPTAQQDIIFNLSKPEPI
jgi:hypothetical protein